MLSFYSRLSFNQSFFYLFRLFKRKLISLYPPARKENSFFKIKYNQLLPYPIFPHGKLAVSGKKVAVVVGYHSPSLAVFQLPIIVSLRKAGYIVYCLLPTTDIPATQYYLKAGADRVISYEDIYVDCKNINLLFQEFYSCLNPISFAYKSIPIGKFIVSSLMRYSRNGDIRSLLQDKKLVFKYFKKSFIATNRSIYILKHFSPNLICLFDKGYSPEGELTELALAQDIHVSTINTAHKSGSIIGKLYSKSNSDVHFSKPSDSLWYDLIKMPFPEDNRNRVLDEIWNSYNNNSWYDEVATQVNTRYHSRSELISFLKLDPHKPCVVLFPHLFWDATFFWGIDLFEDYVDWFTHVVSLAASMDHINWIIKIHPSNITKNIRDGYKGEFSEILLLKKLFVSIPDHFTIIEPSTNISTLSLYSIMDYCLTVRGTVGIEAALFGKTVLTAGTGRYDGLGFTIDSQSKSQYLNRIANIIDIPNIDKHQVELAQRYAYGLFILRSIKLSSIDFRYSKDSSASLQFTNNMDSSNIHTFKDINLLSQWFSSLSHEDLIYPLEIQPSSIEL